LGRFNLTVTAPAEIDDLSLEALKALVVQLLSKVAEQERLIAELREENARLKGLNAVRGSSQAAWKTRACRSGPASGSNIGGAGRSCRVSPSRIG
jgi:hypothetical protein